MSEIWHYADGGEARGPVTQAALMEALSRLPDPGQTLVWRDGFENWKPADRVEELKELLLKALRSRRSGEPAVGLVDPAEFKFVEPELKGIGGWLILVAIGQVLGVLRLISDMARYYAEADAKLFQQFPITLYGEAALNLALLALLIYVTVLFFRKSRKFPLYYIYQWLAVIVVPLVSALWVVVTLSMATGQSMSEVAKFDSKVVGELFAIGIGAIIWISYILKSRRVANTFTR